MIETEALVAIRHAVEAEEAAGCVADDDVASVANFLDWICRVLQADARVAVLQ